MSGQVDQQTAAVMRATQSKMDKLRRELADGHHFINDARKAIADNQSHAKATKTDPTPSSSE